MDREIGTLLPRTHGIPTDRSLHIGCRPRVVSISNLISPYAAALRYFKGEGDQVLLKDPDLLPAVFKRELNTAEIYALAGASSDSAVHVHGSIGSRQTIVYFQTEGRYVADQKHHLVQEAGQTHLVNQLSLFRDSAPHGYGTVAFARQVATARQLGIQYISMHAVGSIQDIDFNNGYYTWARFGCDAPLSEKEMAALPKAFAGATRVLDIVSSGPEGAAYWKQHGSGRGMRFDLCEGSRSLQALDGYLKEKGIALSL